MANSEILNDLKFIFEKKTMNQNSILSPLLFNIYMNKLDQFIHRLATDCKKITKHHIPEVPQKYNKMNTKFIKRNLHIAIKKYGSLKAMRKSFNEQKDAYYKKYGHNRQISQKQTIQYIRYMHDFIRAPFY